MLAARKTGGHIDGSILVNGRPRDKFFNRFTGYVFENYVIGWHFLQLLRYVEQTDLLMPMSTVREAILFAANTRLSKKTAKQKVRKVDSILRIF